MDMYLESLARLNAHLQHTGSKTTVVAFIITPAATHGFTVDALKGQAAAKQLRDVVEGLEAKVGRRIFEHALRYDLQAQSSSCV